MVHCPSCGSEQPDNARFCGFCGRILAPSYDEFTRVRSMGYETVVSDDTALTALSAAPSENAAEQWPTQEIDWLRQRPVPSTPPLIEDEEDEEQEEVFAVPLVDSRMPAGTIPNASLVQGTPQLGNAPMVDAAPPVGQAATPEVGPPMAQASFYNNATIQAPPSPAHLPQTPPHGNPSSSQPAKPQKPPKAPRPGGCVAVISIIIICLVIIATSIGVFFIVVSPVLTLHGSGSVQSGGSLALHGDHFFPRSHVQFTLDDGLPVAISVTAMQNRTNTPTALTNSMQVAERTAASLASPATLLASITGSFDAVVTVDTSWASGQHTLHATEVNGISSRNAILSFTIATKPALLSLASANLDFGSVEKGKKATISEAISDTGDQPLTWTATTETVTWLSLQNAKGIVQPGASPQLLTLTADTSSLGVGAYTTMLHVASDGGKSDVPITMQVVPAANQSKLAVAPPVLDFKTMDIGKQASLTATLTNTGTTDLNWQANTANATWITLSNTAGTVQANGQPATLTVSVDTTGLTNGNYAATVSIHSNGGDAQIAITLVVAAGATPTPTPTSPTPTPTIGVTPTPTITPTPVTTPPTLAVNPANFSNGSGCSYGANNGWTCVAVLTNVSSNNGSLNWSVSSNNTPTVSFSASSGTLNPSASTRVVAFVSAKTVCPASATFTFVGPANTVQVPWSCAAPTLSASPTSVGPANCPSTQGVWQCTITLTDTVGGASWTASSDLGATFSPTSGTVYPGGPSTVTVTISGCASGTFSFAGPANTVKVNWTCIG